MKRMEMEEKMIEYINYQIAQSKKCTNSKVMEYENTRIEAMISLLEIATEKKYYCDNDVVREKK